MSPDPNEPEFDFGAVGGVPIVKAGGDPTNPGDLEWNFGVTEKTPDVAADAGPDLYARFPNLRGRWDGATTVNHHEAVRRVLGENIKAQYQPAGTCFPAGTPILMADGTEKPIESVQVGDLVCTHRNTARRVLRTMQRAYTGETTTFRGRGMRGAITTTAEHPILVVRNGSTNRRYPDKYTPGVTAWVKAADLTATDRVLLPYGVRVDGVDPPVIDLADHVPNRRVKLLNGGYRQTVGETQVQDYYSKRALPRRVLFDVRLARLIGLYLAEGSADWYKDRPHKLTWTFGGDENHFAAEVVALLHELFGLPAIVDRPKDKDTVIRVVCRSATLTRLFSSLCGLTAYHKHVPTIAFTAPATVKLALIRGWMDGDGSIRVGAHRQNAKWKTASARGTTASVRLAREMQRLSALVGVMSSVTVRKKADHQRVASNDVNYNGEELFTIYPEHRPTDPGRTDRSGITFHRTEHGFVVHVRDLQRASVTDLPVYNIEVEEEHTYVANGVAVHNCGGRAGSRCLDLLQLIAKAAGKRVKFHYASHAWLYYLARREYGMLGRGDGVPGGSIQVILRKYGPVTREEANDLQFAGDEADRLAVAWGAGRIDQATVRRLTDLASDNVVTAQVEVKSAQELADGIAAGGVGLCDDDQAYSMTRDSEGVCRAVASKWYHYHVRSGVRTLRSGRKVFQYDQSWGERTPGGPLLDGCPGNVFGVDWDVQDRLCRTGNVSVLFSFPVFELESSSPEPLPWVL